MTLLSTAGAESPGGSIIDRIVAFKRAEVGARAAITPPERLETMARSARAPRDLRARLAAPGVAVIAEVKRKSPSRGVMIDPFQPLDLARRYDAAGAAAISVLADEEFFGVGVPIVTEVAADPGVSAPVLYKDFIIDPYQIIEARAVGADAVLIVTRAIEAASLAILLALADDLGMSAIVEVFNAEDVRIAAATGARIIGINNRDLASFQVDPDRARRLRDSLPPGVLTIAESGLAVPADVTAAGRAGFDAVLVGEAFVTATDRSATVAAFVAAGREIAHVG